MELYLIEVELGEEIPYYTFLIEAESDKEAVNKAESIAKKEYSQFTDIHITPINNLEDVKRHLLIELSILF